MANRRDKRRSDRRRGSRRPPVRRDPVPRVVVDDEELPDLPLLHALDDALADAHPLSLLQYASGIVAASEPDPFADLRAPGADSDPETERVELTALIESFLDVGLRQTDALLLVLKELIGDELLRRRIRTTVAERKRPVPGWLLRLDQVQPTRAVFLGHMLGDGENVLLSVDLPVRKPLTVVLYVDHNMGTIVKDAFALDIPLDEVVESLHSLDDTDDITSEELPLADARARLEQAVGMGRSMFPPIENDTWPMVRPLVEWMLRLMPEGGTGYPEPEWSQAQIDAIADEFFASRHAAGLVDDDERRSILDHLLWFGAEYGTFDPLRQSPVTVEIVLLDLVPRKVVADVDYLDQVPDVLRALVRFAHDERGVPPRYTRETLASIDEFEPEYRRIIRTPRHQGPMALLERMGAVPPLGEGDEMADASGGSYLDDEESLVEYYLRHWAASVGGHDALRNLDTSPLPIEELDLSPVAEDIRDPVAHVGGLVADTCDALYDEEFRTVCYRILTRIAAGDPRVFTRGRPETAAAAVMWIAAKTNGGYGMYGDVTVKELMAQLGLTGSPAQRAQPMLAALGVAAPFDWSLDAALGDSELLTSAHRRWLVERRDAITAMLAPDGES